MTRGNGNGSGRTGKTLVYLVRHGETEWNRDRRFQGQLDVPLSRLGIEQAQAVANWLANQQISFSALYSSDLKRAAQTAAVIGRHLGLAPVQVQALREINVGEWQGLSVQEVEARYPGKLQEWYDAVDRFNLPGGESIPLVQERVFDFFQKVVTEHVGDAIIIVSHGAALAALTAAIFGWDLVETWHTRRGRLGNTGVSVIAVDTANGTAETLALNSMQHLDRPTGLASVLDPQA